MLKRCSEVEQSKTRGAVRFSLRVAASLRKARALKRRQGGLSDHGYAVARGKLHAELDRLLLGMSTEPDIARLAKLLRKHRANVLQSLDHDAVVASNHRAEREVRPAVIAWKVSAGNRTEASAEAHAVLANVLRTLCRQGRPIVEGLTMLLSHGSGPRARVRPHPRPWSGPGPRKGAAVSSSHAHRVTHIGSETRYNQGPWESELTRFLPGAEGVVKW